MPTPESLRHPHVHEDTGVCYLHAYAQTPVHAHKHASAGTSACEHVQTHVHACILVHCTNV